MTAALAVLGILAAIVGIVALAAFHNARRARQPVGGVDGLYWQPPGRKSPENRLNLALQVDRRGDHLP